MFPLNLPDLSFYSKNFLQDQISTGSSNVQMLLSDSYIFLYLGSRKKKKFKILNFSIAKEI